MRFWIIGIVCASVWVNSSVITATDTTLPSQTAAAVRNQTRGSLEPGQADEVATSARSAVLPRQWQQPETEARGVWFAANDILGPREQVIEKLDAVTSANFNTVMLDMWFRGYVAYPGSQIAPKYPKIGDDTFEWLVRESRQRGLRVDLWPEYGFYAYHTPDATKDKSMGPVLDANPHLVSLDSSGAKYLHNPTIGDFYSMCPANPQSHEILTGIIAEAVERFDPDGVNLDRIRFAEENYCYCAHCQKQFKADTGLDLEVFAAQTNEAQTFLRWKRERTADAVARIREAIHEVAPGLPITAYVVGPAEMDSRAQGWDLWVKRGLVDAVAVSMYGADIRQPARRAIELIGGDTSRLICSISCGQPTSVYLSNIAAARQFGAIGQFTWYVGDLLDDVKALSGGPYARPARFPLEATNAADGEAPN